MKLKKLQKSEAVNSKYTYTLFVVVIVKRCFFLLEQALIL